MTPFEERDAEFAKIIRGEIGKAKAQAKACGWPTDSRAWHRAYGELVGMYRILEFIDPNPYDAEQKSNSEG